jgi:hypothetical protein
MKRAVARETTELLVELLERTEPSVALRRQMEVHRRPWDYEPSGPPIEEKPLLITLSSSSRPLWL